jgi:menaquinone-dependent protoporphyrinogen oxidase
MTVLVAYGTTGGGTGEIAEWVAEELRAAGLTVRLMPAAEVTDVAGYDALVLGSTPVP